MKYLTCPRCKTRINHRLDRLPVRDREEYVCPNEACGYQWVERYATDD